MGPILPHLRKKTDLVKWSNRLIKSTFSVQEQSEKMFLNYVSSSREHLFSSLSLWVFLHWSCFSHLFPVFPPFDDDISLHMLFIQLSSFSHTEQWGHQKLLYARPVQLRKGAIFHFLHIFLDFNR